MSTAVIIALIGALLFGVLLGWLVGSRQSAGQRQTAEMLRLQRDELVKERDEIRRLFDDSERARSALEADARNFETRMADLQKSRVELVNQFREIGDKQLADARKAFLDQAGEKFTQTVSPMEALLKTYQEKLQTIEKERVDHYAGIREVVEQVRVGQGQVRDEARTLSTALRYAPKMRAALGEQSLQNVLQKAGLSPFADFKCEVSVEGSDGRIRPDVVVRLPGERQLVIDAKCSLNAYVDACNEVDEEKRKKLFEKHVSSIRQHVQQLGSKAYWAQFGASTDYVIMYIPGEQFLTAALEHDDELWQWAFEKRVILATPQNLIAIVGTVATMWNRQQLNERAEEIAKLGKELHSRLATMSEHMKRVGANLATANNAYNQMVGSFESQVFTQARRFETLGAGSAKEIVGPPMVELAPRPLTKIISPNSDNDDPPQIAAE